MGEKYVFLVLLARCTYDTLGHKTEVINPWEIDAFSTLDIANEVAKRRANELFEELTRVRKNTKPEYAEWFKSYKLNEIKKTIDGRAGFEAVNHKGRTIFTVKVFTKRIDLHKND